jgi:hypothetical protein
MRLKAGCPAIDSGSSTLAPAADIAGTPRPQGVRVDVGAYEFRQIAVENRPQYQTVMAPLVISPSPFHSTAIMRFANPDAHAVITVIDVKGRLVAKFDNIRCDVFSWEAGDLPAGIYLVSLESGKNTAFKTVCLVR